MNKIIEKLLSVQFPNITTDVLLQIINATPNPEVATEMLCGLYVEPVIKYKRVNDGKRILTFDLYDKWNEKVEFYYMTDTVRAAYFKRGVKLEEITMENFESLKADMNTPSDDKVYLNIPTGKQEKRSDRMTLESWNKLPYEPTEGELRQREAQDLYPA